MVDESTFRFFTNAAPPQPSLTGGEEAICWFTYTMSAQVYVKRKHTKTSRRFACSWRREAVATQTIPPDGIHDATPLPMRRESPTGEKPYEPHV